MISVEQFEGMRERLWKAGLDLDTIERLREEMVKPADDKADPEAVNFDE